MKLKGKYKPILIIVLVFSVLYIICGISIYSVHRGECLGCSNIPVTVWDAVASEYLGLYGLSNTHCIRGPSWGETLWMLLPHFIVSLIFFYEIVKYTDIFKSKVSK